MKKQNINLKIKNLKDLLFEKSFLQFFTEEFIRRKLNLGIRTDRFNDASDSNGLRYEIKGTVVRDKGDDYRTNKSTFSKKQVTDFIEKEECLILKGRKMCSFKDANKVRFVSIFNKFEFSKFDKFIGVIYFDDVIKIVSYDRKDIEDGGRVSKQFSKDIYSLSLDRNNINDFIEKGLLLSLTYEEVFE